MAARKQVWRDSSGRALADYPRPSVAVDTAVLTVLAGALHVLLVRRDPLDPAERSGAPSRRSLRWGLTGTFLHEGETLAQAVLRSLEAKAGISGSHPQQLYVFDRIDRDDRGRVLSVAHVDVIMTGPDTIKDSVTRAWRPVTTLPPLVYDHADIIELAVQRVREEYAEHPDPYRLLPGPFSLRQLQDLHESVLGRSVPRDSFRRHMREHLRPVNRTTEGRVGKPAQLFRTR